MKKFLGSLFLLLVAGGAAAPYVSGYFTKKYFNDAIQVISKSQSYKIEVESYDMGWLHSTARIKLKLPENAQGHLCADSKEPMVLKFEENIQHGPVLFGQGEPKMAFAFARIQEKLVGLDEQLVKTCASLVDFKWPIPPADIYSSDTIVAFNGDFHSKFKGKPFEYKQNDRTIKWQGLSGEMNLGNRMTVLNYMMLIPSLEANEQNTTVKVKDISLSGNHQKLPNKDMWLGDFKLNIASVHFQEGSVEVALDGMTFGHVVRLANDLLTASANYIVDSVVVDQIKLGPINMMFSFHHLEPSFIEMVKNIEETAKQTPEGYLGALKKYQSPDKEDALSIINKQLKLTPEAKIDQIIVQNQKGQVLVNAIASLGGPDSKLDKLENYLMLMTMGKASGEFIIDEPVFDYLLEKQSQETANSLPKEFWAQQQTTQEKWVAGNVAKLKDEAVQTGVVVREGEKIISRFKYENNSFTINGKSLNEIMAKHAELNKPKPEPVPAPAASAPDGSATAPAPAVPGATPAPTTAPGTVAPSAAPASAAPAPTAAPTGLAPVETKPMVNNPNMPDKPSEPMPVSQMKDVPNVPAPAEAPKPADVPVPSMGDIPTQSVPAAPAAPQPAKQ